jgi:transcriptional regulator with XRE-family HTH domain
MARPSEKSKNALSGALVELRRALGESQQTFATRVHMALATIARYETDRHPRGKALALFARVANEAGRPDLASVFEQALATELGDQPPTPKELVWVDALREVEQDMPATFDAIVREIAAAMESLKERIQDPVRLSRLERLLVLLRQMTENTAERALLAEARELARTEGTTESAALLRILRENPRRYIEIEAQRQNTLRGTQHDTKRKQRSPK